MSEFTCVNGHILLGLVCPRCGTCAARMDGYSSSELSRMERFYEENPEEDWEQEPEDD